MLDRDKILASLGKSIRKAREAKGLTQERLAELAGLDSTYISGIERGIRNPGIFSVAKIASGLGLTLTKLMEEVK